MARRTRHGLTVLALGSLLGSVFLTAGCVETMIETGPIGAAASPLQAPKRPAPPAAVASAYTAAAAENAKLCGEMDWSFAGRAQHGWAIYCPLVCSLVGTEAEPSSPEFAEAVAAWQKKTGVRPADGVITADVWSRMMRALQSNRAFSSTEPPAGELVEVPATEWLDPGRAPELRMLRRDAYEAYERMVAAARADLGSEGAKYFKLVSGYRSPEYQAALREKAGNPSTAALAVNSPHFTGRAMDMYVGGEPVSTADANRAVQVATPAYKWLVRNAKRYGFRPYFYEPWHWEYVP